MSTIGICCINVVSFVSLAAVVVSLGTDFWVKVTVDRSKLTSDARNLNHEIYHSRRRGVFRTCFDEDATWLQFYKPLGKTVNLDSNCLIEDIFKIASNPATASLGNSYATRNDLIKVHLAFQAIAVLALVATLLAGICGCCKYSASSVRITGLLSLISSLFMCGAMAVFHFYEHLEKQRINNNMFYKVWSGIQVLQNNYTYTYHLSYMLGWIGMILSFLAAICYFVIANDVIRKKERIRDKQERYAEERRRNLDHLVENPVQYGRQRRDPYRF